MLQDFSNEIGKLHLPKRVMWLTDMYDGQNGISTFLQQFHREIKQRNLPIDIVVCSDTVVPDDHLIVVKPIFKTKLPYYKSNSIGFPDLLSIQNLFFEGGYDRIISSTEGIMGLISIYLKNAFSVKSFSYIHNDWLTFAKKVMNVEEQNLSRVKRILRTYYNSFDNLIVLSEDHKNWFSNVDMNIPESRIIKTAHWVDDDLKQTPDNRAALFNISEDSEVLLYVGRISREKGVMEIPDIYREILKANPKLKMVFAGTGPQLDELKEKLPEAIFMGWVEKEKLPEVYSSSDLLILPSKFDTFGCVVIEALRCGLPVLAYNTKGPKDIIIHGECGFLAKNYKEMITCGSKFISDSKNRTSYKKSAVSRSKIYNPDSVINDFLSGIGINE